MNRLLNRLKYKTPGAHLHKARSSIIKISTLLQLQFLFYFPFTRIVAQTDRLTDRETDRRTWLQKQYVPPMGGPQGPLRLKQFLRRLGASGTKGLIKRSKELERPVHPNISGHKQQYTQTIPTPKHDNSHYLFYYTKTDVSPRPPHTMKITFRYCFDRSHAVYVFFIECLQYPMI